MDSDSQQKRERQMYRTMFHTSYTSIYYSLCSYRIKHRASRIAHIIFIMLKELFSEYRICLHAMNKILDFQLRLGARRGIKIFRFEKKTWQEQKKNK